MDHSGNNRYELLFMDDDISDPLDNIVAKSKKQVKTAAVGGGGGGVPSKTTTTTKQQNVDGSTNKMQSNKKPNQAEKENKPLTMNKNESNKKPSGGAVNATDKFNKQQQQGGAVINARKRNGPNVGGGTASAVVNETAGQGQGIRNANFRQQNGETREQRNNRRNARENGYNNNNNTTSAAAAATGGVGGGEVMSPQQRQLRDRDNRGPPRNRNFENRGGKREFDRQSGSDKTGVKSIDKRDGAGAHNWGSVKETIDDVNKNGVVEGKEINVEKAEESGNEQAEQTHVEEETKELTLDEWKAQKQQRAKPTFNIRKAGEGEDTSQWKKMIVLTNNKKKENESEDELEFDPAMYPQRVGRQQRVLDIQFNFNDGRRGGGGFGGRGRGGRGPRSGGNGGAAGPNPGGERPAGGRGGFEGSRGPGGNLGRGKRNYGSHQNAAPKVNDERQFPTLG